MQIVIINKTKYLRFRAQTRVYKMKSFGYREAHYGKQRSYEMTDFAPSGGSENGLRSAVGALRSPSMRAAEPAKLPKIMRCT